MSGQRHNGLARILLASKAASRQNQYLGVNKHFERTINLIYSNFNHLCLLLSSPKPDHNPLANTLSPCLSPSSFSVYA
jgi:hypothetical protein